MNEQLTIPGRSRGWQLDPATRRRGRRGVAEARKVIRRSKVRAVEQCTSESSADGRHLVADAA